jgi:transaldolase
MKFFLDSAKVDEIAYALKMWNLDGVTTNPRHIKDSGKPFMTAIKDIASLFVGTDKPISVEINPHHIDYEAMTAEGENLAAISPNFVVKLPATEAGFKASAILRAEGIRTNLTLVFSTIQALQAMRMDAYFVSPFIGWKEANGEEIQNFIKEIVTVRNNYHFKTQVLVAAIRNGRQIVDAAISGADIVTAGLAVFKESIEHPYTDMGLKRFSNFWDQTTYE